MLRFTPTIYRTPVFYTVILRIAVLSAVCVVMAFLPRCVWAQTAAASATLSANPSILLADGRSKTTISVTLNDGSGRAIADGTVVHFTTTSGTLDPTVAISSGGVARASLTSSAIPGQAVVAASFIDSSGAANGAVTVEFTSDSSLANTDQSSANWIRINSNEYLAYSADTRVVDAAGHKRGVRIAYRGLQIDADAAQIDLATNIVRATKSDLKRVGYKPLHVDSLYYDLDGRSGIALIENAPGQRTVEQVRIDGNNLSTTKLPVGEKGGDYDFEDLSQGHVLITAAEISVQPHQQLQLARATIYVDSKKLVSMPNQVMPLNTNQIFGQQVLGYGTNGLFLDVPYYASLSPTSTGMFSLRSSAAAIQAGTYYSGRSGLALDYDRSYSDGNRQGDLKLIGISSSDFGMRWTQSQTFRGGTQAYFYADSPEHQSVYSTINLRHDYRAIAVNFSGTNTMPLLGTKNLTTGHTYDINGGTPEHLLFGGHKLGVRYSEQFDYTSAQQSYSYGGTTLSSTSVTHSLGIRFDTPPITPARNTNITDNFTIEKIYSDTGHYSAVNLVGNVQMNSRLSRLVTASASYNYTHQPQFGIQNALIVNNNILALYNATDKQNFTMNLGATSPDRRWALNLSSTYGLPTKDSTVGTSLSYRLSSATSFQLSNYLSHIAGYGYRDLDFSVAERIGGRDLILSWDQIVHRWEFNLAQASF